MLTFRIAEAFMIDQYRSDFAEFNIDCAREHYLFHSGQKNALEIAHIYERYHHLFDRSLLDRLKHEVTSSADFENENASARRFFAFAIEQYLENSVKQLTEEIGQFEAGATVEWKDNRITFQDATVAITRERDRWSRQTIYRKRLAVIEQSNTLRSARLLKLHETARSLDYPSYTALFEHLRRLDYSELALEAATLLPGTEESYVSKLDQMLSRSLGLRIGQAERSDAMYLAHLTSFDQQFSQDQMLKIYTETMAGLGIRVADQSNISIDTEPRPRKNPRAFCMPISIPDDIRLVIRPTGGQSDYQAFLHESGHAQHYGWASPDLQPEFKYTGDYALSETYAFLFNHLISDNNWLAAFPGISNSAEFTRSVMLARLLSVRRYVAKLTYERQLHLGESLESSATLFAELQTRATCFKTDRSDFLFDLDDSFYSASYLRAWAFEVSLREYLKTRFGSHWWASKRTGDFLKEIWETGDRYSADEMAAQIGIGPIRFDPLIDEFNEALK